MRTAEQEKVKGGLGFGRHDVRPAVQTVTGLRFLWCVCCARGCFGVGAYLILDPALEIGEEALFKRRADF